MAGTPPRQYPMTVEEYLRREAVSPVRREDEAPGGAAEGALEAAT